MDDLTELDKEGTNDPVPYDADEGAPTPVEDDPSAGETVTPEVED